VCPTEADGPIELTIDVWGVVDSGGVEFITAPGLFSAHELEHVRERGCERALRVSLAIPVGPDGRVSVSDQRDGVKRQPADGVDQRHRNHHLHHLPTTVK